MAFPITGMRGFLLMWGGQLVSMVGTGMSRFALAIWAWEITGKATALALVALFSFGPSILFTPLAGVLADRWKRKTVLIISDLGAGLSTIAVLILYLADALELWHLFVAAAFSSVFNVFQFPAYSAAVTTMVPRTHYTRANALTSLVRSGSRLLAPIIAGALIGFIGVGGVLIIDIATFSVAVLLLLAVRVPQPCVIKTTEKALRKVFSDLREGLVYVFGNSSLRGFLMVYSLANLADVLTFVLLAAMILARTGSDRMALGTVQTMMGVGGIVGAGLLVLWGGTKRRKMYFVLASFGLSNLLGLGLLGVGRTVTVWIIGGFVYAFFGAFIDGNSRTIWQEKIPAGMQGRAFSIRAQAVNISTLLAMIAYGPLADRIFEPAMLGNGMLERIFSPLVGQGAGAGMAAMFVIGAIWSGIICFGAFAFRSVRDIDTILPNCNTNLEQDG